jgi:hypothetical protein
VPALAHLADENDAVFLAALTGNEQEKLRALLQPSSTSTSCRHARRLTAFHIIGERNCAWTRNGLLWPKPASMQPVMAA